MKIQKKVVAEGIKIPTEYIAHTEGIRNLRELNEAAESRKCLLEVELRPTAISNCDSTPHIGSDCDSFVKLRPGYSHHLAVSFIVSAHNINSILELLYLVEVILGVLLSIPVLFHQSDSNE